MTHQVWSNGPPLFPHEEYVNDTNAVLSEIKRILYWRNQFEIRKRREDAYTAFNKDPVGTSGGSINLHLKNPENSGISLAVYSIGVGSQFRGEYSIHDSFSSAPSGGTGNGVDNMLMDSADTGTNPTAEVNTNVTFTEDNTHHAEVLPSGGEGAAMVGGDAFATRPHIEPGREIVIELQNDSSTERTGSITVGWVEEQYVYSEA